MKYFKTQLVVSSGKSPWEFYEVPDDWDEEYLKDYVLEVNQWVYNAECFTYNAVEITETDYRFGVQAVQYYASDSKMLQENVFPVREWAILLANPNKPVRIGYPNMHQVYRMNDKRELSYQYDYNAAKFGILKQFLKAYPV
ncbi:hypothetical protein [Escherichia phage vB_EcoM_JNE01]|nr:hypothetical protein [Escherichia phage vB_EcoM_JNE01]